MRAAGPWSKERIAMLETLWGAGVTAQAIAGELGGVSRSAVLGKIFRLRAEAAAATPVAGEPTGGAPRDSGLAPAKASPVRRRPRRRRNDSQPSGPPPPARGKSLLELTNASCRWPHGTPGSARFHFCGKLGADLENGIPYCTAHRRRAYRQHPRHAAARWK